MKIISFALTVLLIGCTSAPTPPTTSLPHRPTTQSWDQANLNPAASNPTGPLCPDRYTYRDEDGFPIFCWGTTHKESYILTDEKSEPNKKEWWGFFAVAFVYTDGNPTGIELMSGHTKDYETCIRTSEIAIASYQSSLEPNQIAIPVCLPIPPAPVKVEPKKHLAPGSKDL